jgi:GTP cyclohydrolase I
MKKKQAQLCNDNIAHLFDFHATLQGDLDKKEMVKDVENAFQEVLVALKINWRGDHNTKDTPRRVAEMLVNETFRGRYDLPPVLTSFPNVKKLDQLMAVGPIDVKSTCAHHFQPVYGKAWIGIKPSKSGRLIGLSKFNRVVDFFARRPQIQEEMTVQIADFLQTNLKPDGLIVLTKARHFCMCARGVNQETDTVQSVAYGELRDPNSKLKDEFFSLIKQ